MAIQPEIRCRVTARLFILFSSERVSRKSIKLLKEAGVDFEKHKTCGISQDVFAEYLTTSGTAEEFYHASNRTNIERRRDLGVFSWNI